MMKELEKIAKGLILFSLSGLLIAWALPEPAMSAITVTAEVAADITCTTPLDGQTNSFGTIDDSQIYKAITSSTTVTSNGSIYMKIYDSGDGSANPGLYKDPDLIESPTAANPSNATDTIIFGAEGYGIQATTAAANTLNISTRYDQASSTDIVGGLKYGSGASEVVASSSSSVTTELVEIDYKVAVANTTPSGSYSDSVTITCTAS